MPDASQRDLPLRHHRPVHRPAPLAGHERALRPAHHGHDGGELMLGRRAARDGRGQVLVLVALLLTVLLAFSGLAIDVGRQVAERRHIQTAADAGALAACRGLTAGESDAAAIADARETALANLATSPAGASATIAPDGSPVYASGHAGDPAYLTSGILINGTSVRVAITSSVATTVARVIG